LARFEEDAVLAYARAAAIHLKADASLSILEIDRRNRDGAAVRERFPISREIVAFESRPANLFGEQAVFYRMVDVLKEVAVDSRIDARLDSVGIDEKNGDPRLSLGGGCLRTKRARQNSCCSYRTGEKIYASRLHVESDAEDFSVARSLDAEVLTSSMRTVHTDLSRARFAATRHGDTEPVSRFHKLNPSGISNTIRAGTASDHGAFTSPRPIHPFSPRCITVREAARLHSYPDWFRLHVTKWHGFRQIGNSVPPLLARAVASKLMEASGVAPWKDSRVIQPGDPALLTLDMSEASARYGVPSDVIPKRTRMGSEPRVHA
jgi:hypothetical protein